MDIAVRSLEIAVRLRHVFPHAIPAMGSYCLARSGLLVGSFGNRRPADLPAGGKPRTRVRGHGLRRSTRPLVSVALPSPCLGTAAYVRRPHGAAPRSTQGRARIVRWCTQTMGPAALSSDQRRHTTMDLQLIGNSTFGLCGRALPSQTAALASARVSWPCCPRSASALLFAPPGHCPTSSCCSSQQLVQSVDHPETLPAGWRVWLLTRLRGCRRLGALSPLPRGQACCRRESGVTLSIL